MKHKIAGFSVSTGERGPQPAIQFREWRSTLRRLYWEEWLESEHEREEIKRSEADRNCLAFFWNGSQIPSDIPHNHSIREEFGRLMAKFSRAREKYAEASSMVVTSDPEAEDYPDLCATSSYWSMRVAEAEANLRWAQQSAKDLVDAVKRLPGVYFHSSLVTDEASSLPVDPKSPGALPGLVDPMPAL